MGSMPLELRRMELSVSTPSRYDYDEDVEEEYI
jgi:hypothetical protein